MFNNIYIQFINNFERKKELENIINDKSIQLKNTNQLIKWLIENQNKYNFKVFKSVIDCLAFHKNNDCYNINKPAVYTLTISCYTYECVLASGITIWNPLTCNLDYLTDYTTTINFINEIKELL